MKLIIPVFLYLIMIDYTIGAVSEIEWTSKLKRELLTIFYKTSPDEPGHKERMKQKWDQKFLQYRDVISGEELRQHAINLIEKICHPIASQQLFFTPELNKEVLKIYHQTRPDWMFQENRMRKAWNEKFPHLNAETNNFDLRSRAIKLLERLRNGRREKKRKSFRWQPDMDNYLVKMSHKILPYETDRSHKMKMMFDLKFPQYKDKVTVESLRQHTIKLTKLKKLQETTYGSRDAKGKKIIDQSTYGSSDAKGKKVINQSNEASTSTSKIKNLNENYLYHPIDLNQPLSQHQEIYPVLDSDIYQHDPSTSRQTRHIDLNKDPVEEHEQSDSSN